MSLSVQYNGEDLTRFLHVLDGYTIHGGADWDPSYNEIKGIDGVEFIKTRRKTIITLNRKTKFRLEYKSG